MPNEGNWVNWYPRRTAEPKAASQKPEALGMSSVTQRATLKFSPPVSGNHFRVDSL